MSPAIRAATLLVAILSFLAAPSTAADTIGFTSDSSNITEGNNDTVPVAITVRRTGDGIGAVSVDWTTVPGTALPSVVSAIAAGVDHTVALKTDGAVVAWGANSSGQTAIPIGLSGVSAIAAGYAHTVALKTDGTVVAWGDDTWGQTTVPVGLSGVSAIAAGYAHTVALKTDGTVVAWGYNVHGETAVPVRLTGVRAIAASAVPVHTVALRNDGSVVSWGSNVFGEATVPVGLSGVSAIAAGGNHTVALKSDGTVVAWGPNNSGDTAVPVGLSGVSAIAAGGNHTVALKSDGTVVAWGNNDFGQTTVPVGLSAVRAIATGYSHTVALKSDGTLVAWGAHFFGQITVPLDLSEIQDYLFAAGTLNWADGDTADKTVVVQILNDALVESDETFSVVLSNPTGGASLLSLTHTVTIVNDDSTLGFAGGASHMIEGSTGTVPVAITVRRTGSSIGTVGVNWTTQLGTAWPFTNTGISAIAAGNAHTVALKNDGTVVAWGSSRVLKKYSSTKYK